MDANFRNVRNSFTVDNPRAFGHGQWVSQDFDVAPRVGRPTVSDGAGSGDPRTAGGSSWSRESGDLRSAMVRGQETRAQQGGVCGPASRETYGQRWCGVRRPAQQGEFVVPRVGRPTVSDGAGQDPPQRGESVAPRVGSPTVSDGAESGDPRTAGGSRCKTSARRCS